MHVVCIGKCPALRQRRLVGIVGIIIRVTRENDKRTLGLQQSIEPKRLLKISFTFPKYDSWIRLDASVIGRIMSAVSGVDAKPNAGEGL